MPDSEDLHRLSQLTAEVEKASAIESELGLLFYLAPVNSEKLSNTINMIAAGGKGYGETSSVLVAEYPPLQFEPDRIREKINHLEQGPAASLGTLWSLRISQLNRTLELLEVRGTDSFTQLAAAEFGRPSQELLTLAESILSDPKGATERFISEISLLPDQGWPSPPPMPFESPEVDSETARHYLESVIRYYRLKGVDVRTSDRITARAMVEGGRLWLRNDILFSDILLRRLAVHEVGIHLRRRSRRPVPGHPLLELESPHGPATEEGMTVLAEALTGCLDSGVLRTYAGRVMAIAHSFEGGMQSVIDHLTGYGFLPGEIATLIMRAKRGTMDFSLDGAFPKDLCYLEGARMVIDFIRGGGSISPLFDCMLGIDDIPFLPSGLLEQPLTGEEG